MCNIPDGHFGQHERHGLVLANHLAHRLALHGVLGRFLQRAPSQAHGASGHRRPRNVERAHRNLEALADVAQPVGIRDEHFLERDAAGVTVNLCELSDGSRALMLVHTSHAGPC